jgi:hypothetical protein
VKIIDPGHEYTLDSLDGEQENRLVFVKREGEKYPGNVGAHPGTTCQEVLRALIDRLKYVNGQIASHETQLAICDLENAIYRLEKRAALRHGRSAKFEDIPFKTIVLGWCKCSQCGHVGCPGNCHG